MKKKLRDEGDKRLVTENRKDTRNGRWYQQATAARKEVVNGRG